MRAGNSIHQPIGSELEEGPNPSDCVRSGDLTWETQELEVQNIVEDDFQDLLSGVHWGVRILTGIDSTWLNLD